ncbi:hypothetical protein [Streptomyces sp. B21-083]|uniref:hypothetical protein n=1 Tax=Streptomyces sp. B21-083 TaxID=3039410 RepID=UPI002FF2036C
MNDRFTPAVLFGAVASAAAWADGAPLFWTVTAGALMAGLTWLIQHRLRNRR